MTQHALQSIRRETLAVIRKHCGEGDRVALLDFPSYDNAGDSLIYAGETAYLNQVGASVDYISDVLTHDNQLLEDKVGSGTIFLRGGGNFGDRWPAHQKFREQVVARFPRNKIVALPQGIDYAHSDALKATAAIYATHANLTLMLREYTSYETALAGFPANRVEYCPDLAFGACIDSSPDGSSVDVVKLLRKDSERVDYGEVDTTYSTVQYDWGLRGLNLLRSNSIMMPTMIAYNFPRTSRILYPNLVRSYSRYSRLNLVVAQRILNRGAVILTDRLHAAVLAGMMGKRVVAMDNANKKVSAVYDAYLHRFDNVRFAGTAAEASELVADAVADYRETT